MIIGSKIGFISRGAGSDSGRGSLMNGAAVLVRRTGSSFGAIGWRRAWFVDVVGMGQSRARKRFLDLVKKLFSIRGTRAEGMRRIF